MSEPLSGQGRSGGRDDDLNHAAIRFQVLIYGESDGEMWQADHDYATQRAKAQEIARNLLTFGRRMTTYPPSDGKREVELTAYIYEDRFMNMGDEHSPDWTFEPDPTIDTEVVR